MTCLLEPSFLSTPCGSLWFASTRREPCFLSLILVVHSCVSVVSSRAIIQQNMWIRRRLESHVIVTNSHRLDSFSRHFCAYHGFDVRTASGHALTSYGYCVLKRQVPPIAGSAHVAFEVVDVRYPILSVTMLVANDHRVVFRGQEAQLSTARGAFAPLMSIRGLWYLQVWVKNSREFLLVDSGAACHVCPPAWAQRLSPESKQFQSLTKTTEPGELAPIAEDVRDPGSHPVRQDAPLVEAVRQPPLFNA